MTKAAGQVLNDRLAELGLSREEIEEMDRRRRFAKLAREHPDPCVTAPLLVEAYRAGLAAARAGAVATVAVDEESPK